MPLATIPEALEDLKQGKMIILVDDENRENEGDLTMAAEKVTPEAINFMAKYGRGLICLSLAPEIVDRLKLPLMALDNRSAFKTAFTVSIEAREESPPESPQRTGRGPSSPRLRTTRDRKIWFSPAMSFPFEPDVEAFCSGPVRPRARWTWPDWPGSNLPASSAR